MTGTGIGRGQAELSADNLWWLALTYGLIALGAALVLVIGVWTALERYRDSGRPTVEESALPVLPNGKDRQVAAYDEVVYQQWEVSPAPNRDLWWPPQQSPQELDAWERGVAFERARITEELALCGEIIPMLLIHGELTRRLSFYKWPVGNGHHAGAMELREQARDTLRRGWQA